MRRTVSALIAAVLIISLILPNCGVFAMDQYDEVFTSSDGLWNYVRLADGSVGIYSNVWEKSAYLGEETSVTVPSVIDGNNVTQIGAFAFTDKDKIVSISMPDCIVNISINAFYNCTSLTEVKLSSSLTGIADNAFENCSSLKSVSLPSGVTEISSSLFSGCSSMESFEVPSHITKLSDRVFDGCTSLKSVTVNQPALSFGTFFFNDCPELTDVTVYYNPNADYTNIKDRVTKLIVPDNVNVINANGVQKFTNLQSVTVGRHVESIADGVFTNCPKLSCINGYTGSYAEVYARDNSIAFNSIGKLFEPFRDVPKTSWYFDAVNYCARNGYMAGKRTAVFGPTEYMQRQDFVVVLASIAGEDISSYKDYKWTFSDVKKGSYYYNALMWAVDNKLIGGYENGKFGVGDRITREQICTILYRFASYLGADTKVKGSPEYVLRDYADLNQVSEFSEFGVAWCVQNKLVSGKSKYRLFPRDYASRAEVAQIIAGLGRNGYIVKENLS